MYLPNNKLCTKLRKFQICYFALSDQDDFA